MKRHVWIFCFTTCAEDSNLYSYLTSTLANKTNKANFVLRWLYIVFQGEYLPSLSINYVAINNVLEKLPPQLYYVKMKICYDQGCNGIGVAIATK